MAEVSLVRVDFRLVHGQVVVKWSKVAKATKIIVMNDVIAADKTIKSVYKMAAPAGVKVLCYSLEKGMTKYKETQFGDGRAMVMFKDIKDCYRAWKAGFDMPKLQLGNCPRGADKKALNNEVYATEEEIGLLKEMSAAGVDIVIHTIPEGTCVSFDKVM